MTSICAGSSDHYLVRHRHMSQVAQWMSRQFRMTVGFLRSPRDRGGKGRGRHCADILRNFWQCIRSLRAFRAGGYPLCLYTGSCLINTSLPHKDDRGRETLTGSINPVSSILKCNSEVHLVHEMKVYNVLRIGLRVGVREND